MTLQPSRMHLQQKYVMSSMMSSMIWLLLLVLVRFTSSSFTSTTSGLLGITAMSSVLVKSQTASDSFSNAQANTIQSTEGLLLSQVSVSSGLVASSNASFALSHASDTMPSFMHHTLMGKQLSSSSISNPSMRTQLFPSLLNPPMGIQLSSSLLLYSPIGTHLSSSSSSSSLSFSPVETRISVQYEQSSERKLISTNPRIVQTARTQQSVVLFQSSYMVSSYASSFIIASNSEMFVSTTHSTLEMQTTDSPVAPSPSVPVFNTASSLHESTSNRATASSISASHQILPSFDMYSETVGLSSTTLSGSYQSRTSLRSIWSFKTPGLISRNQMSPGSIVPVTSGFSPSSVGLSDEQHPLPTSYLGFERQTTKVITTAIPASSTLKVLMSSVSNEFQSVQSSHFGSEGQTTEVVASAISSVSTFNFPMPSVSFQSLFSANLPDVSPSDDVVTSETSYETSVSGTLSTLSVVDVSTALHEEQPPFGLASFNLHTYVTEVISSHGNKYASSVHLYLNLNSGSSGEIRPSTVSLSGQVWMTHQNDARSNLPIESSAFVYLSSLVQTYLYDSHSAQFAANPAIQSSLHSTSYAIFTSPSIHSSLQSSTDDNLNSVLTSSLSRSLTSHLFTPMYSMEPTVPSLFQQSEPPVSYAVHSSPPSGTAQFDSVLIHSSSVQWQALLRRLSASIADQTAGIHVTSSQHLPSQVRASSYEYSPSLQPSFLSRYSDSHQSVYYKQLYGSLTASLHAELTSSSILSSKSSPSARSSLITLQLDHSFALPTETMQLTSLSFHASQTPVVPNVLNELPVSSTMFSSSTKSPQLTALLSISQSPVMSSNIFTELPASSNAFFPPTKTIHLAESLLLHAALTSSVASGVFNSELSCKSLSLSSRTLQPTPSLSFHGSQMPAISSMFRRLPISSNAFSSTKTPQLTASCLLYSSQTTAVSGVTNGPSPSRTLQRAASLSLHASQTPVISIMIDRHSNKPFHPMSQTDKIQPSSRRLLAVTSEAAAMTTSSLTNPTLDQSFSTNLYWLKLDIIVPEGIDIKERDFITTMESRLATAYSEGKNRRDERQAAVQDLLGKLNPDNDPLLNIRRRRAVTVDGNAAQVIDISRNIVYPVNVALVFYIAEGDTIMPAGESKEIFDELTLQEMTAYLQVVVKSYPVEFIEPVVITTTPAPSLDVLWIILGVLGGCAFIFCGCCCCFCIFCRRPLKPSRDGPMDIDTLKMLQYKQKYPYKPYKTPNQTPRGFDVAKETGVTVDSGIANEAGGSNSGVKLQSSGTGSILKNQLNSFHAPRLDVDSYSSSSNRSLSGDIHAVPPLDLKTLQDPAAKKSPIDNEEDAFDKAASSIDPSTGGRSRRSAGMYQPRLLPRRTQMIRDGDELSHKSGHNSARSAQSLSTSHEADELRRIYHETQREITRVLEPDIIPDQLHMTYVAPDRRTKSRGKSSKRRRKAEMQETEFGGKTLDDTLPDTHYARKPSKKQIETRRRPQALQEARRKVHNLIDEAFSLVGLPKNAVSPVPPLATNATPTATDVDEQTNIANGIKMSLFQRKVTEAGASLSVEGKDHSRKVSEAQGTRVVVLTVAHQVDKEADIVWNPYNAGDALTQLQKSQQLTSVPGGVEFTHTPHQAASHLTMPHPVSVPETSREPWLKGLAGPQQAEGKIEKPNQSSGRLANTHDEKSSIGTTVDNRQRRPSTGLRRASADSDTKMHNTAPNDPYLDPYLKRSFSEELDGTFPFSPLSDGPTTTEEDPYVMALSTSTKPNLKLKQSDTDMLSTLPKEHRVGKPIAEGYDEFDVSKTVNSKDNSGQLVAAIREELVRLAKRSGQHGSSS